MDESSGLMDYLPICLILLLPSILFVVFLEVAARVRTARRARRVKAEAQKRLDEIQKRGDRI